MRRLCSWPCAPATARLGRCIAISSGLCSGSSCARPASRTSRAELTAETFASALESIGSYDPAKGRADQWLFGIARNVLGKSHRRGRVEAAARERFGMPRLVLDDHAMETISRLTASDEATLALAELPPEQRQAIEARVIGERNYTDIARELRCSEAVVRKRVSRGLRALRTRLAGER